MNNPLSKREYTGPSIDINTLSSFLMSSCLGNLNYVILYYFNLNMSHWYTVFTMEQRFKPKSTYYLLDYVLYSFVFRVTTTISGLLKILMGIILLPKPLLTNIVDSSLV